VWTPLALAVVGLSLALAAWAGRRAVR